MWRVVLKILEQIFNSFLVKVIGFVLSILFAPLAGQDNPNQATMVCGY